MRAILRVCLSVSLGLVLNLPGCEPADRDGDPLDSTVISAETDPPADTADLDALTWEQLAPGVERAWDGDQVWWWFSGVEGHEWLLDEVQARREAGDEDFPADDLREIAERVIGQGERAEDVQQRARGKSKTYTATISTVGDYGLTASAYARRGWGYTRAEARVKIDGNEKTDTRSTSDACIKSCSSSATATVSPSSQPCSCYAYAYANAGGSTTYTERTTCPGTCSG